MLRKRNWKTLMIVVVLAMMVIVSACGGGNNGNNDSGNNNQSNADGDSPSVTQPADEGSSAVGPDGKYDPPITLTTVRAETPNVDRLPDQTLDDNVWTREYLSELGIELKNDWIVNAQQFKSKMMVTMVSGELPDFFVVDAQQFQTLAQAGQLADLTEIYEEYASDLVKANLSDSDGIALKSGTVDGKLLGIAKDGGGSDDAPLLYIRDDWLRNMNLEPPTTMEELIDIAIAFSTGDPDGDGINGNTYGLAISNNVFGEMTAINGFLNGYGAYGNNPTNGSGTNLFFLNDGGKAILADIQPEVKHALGKLNELFEAGAIHPEFSVMDDGAMANQLTAGKVGMTYGAFWIPTWPINNMKANDESVDWGVYEAPSSTGSPIIAQSAKMPSEFLVVSKNAKNPEAVFKIINYTTEIMMDPNIDMERYHTITKNDQLYQIHGLAPMYVGKFNRNQEISVEVAKALKANDPSMLTEDAKAYYNQVKDYEAGDYTKFAGYTLWNPEGVFYKLGIYKDEGRILKTAYTGAPTPTMLERGPALRDLQVKAFMDIIMGAKELDYFDEFVEQWLAQGGQAILDEVNATGQIQ